MNYRYDSSLVPSTATGFSNPGNYCYFISVTQALLSCSSLAAVARANDSHFKRNKFASEYRTLWLNLLNNVPSDIYGLIKAYKDTSSFEVTGAQECAADQLVNIINTFNYVNVANRFSLVYENTIKCPHCSRVSSSIGDLTYYSVFAPSVTITDPLMFAKYITDHTNELTGYVCKGCRRELTKTDRVYRLRVIKEILVLMFPKFSGKYMVWFPESFTIPAIDREPFRYNLVAKINHSGTTSGGHYWAHVLRAGAWYNVNDSGVSAGTPAPEESTFLVFYHLAN